jgi:VanZ family protein
MKFLRFHAPVLIYAGLIFWGSSISQVPNVLPGIDFGDLILHLLEYSILGVLLGRSAFRWNLKYPKTAILIITFGIGAAYAASDEIHQLFVPGRFSSIYDWLADIFGLAIGIMTSYIFLRGKDFLESKSEV